MSVPQPDYLHTFNEASGATITNYGSKATAYVLDTAGATENTDWIWHPDAGPSPYLGYYEGVTGQGANMPWASTAQTGPGTSIVTINAMIAFNITDLPGAGFTVFMAGSGEADITIRAQNKVGSNFDVFVDWANSGSTHINTTFTGLTFGTDYSVATALDVTTLSAVIGTARLNATEQNTGTSNWVSHSLVNGWPFFSRSSGFDIYFGIIGKVRAMAYQRGGTAWTSSELTSINADPAFITGWPSAGGAADTYLMAARRHTFVNTVNY